MTNNTRILIIDDDMRVRESIRLVLEAQGFNVEGATDGNKGLLLHKSTPFDVAIIDMFMPQKDGIETIRDFTAQFPNLGIIAISGGGDNFLGMAQRFGAVEALSKPFDAEDLIDAVKRIAKIS